jgi:hypothetical protein
MPAFAYKSKFREGQWRCFRRFMLEERRDASARYQVIAAERERIGEVRILYDTEKDSEGKVVAVFERRVGIAVEPRDSSLAKLLAAYVSLGGNPFDISMFLSPDSDVGVGEEEDDNSTGLGQTLGIFAGTTERVIVQPGGGILHPNNIKYTYDQSVNDGDTNLKKYRTSRIGGKRYTAKEGEIADIMERARGWISKEIHFKRTRIEEQILKLCDLREQLDQEVEDLVWATYGEVSADESYDPSRFNDSLTAGNIAYFFDSTFRVPDTKEIGRVPYDNTADSGKPGSVNLPVLAGFDSLVSDDDDEDNTGF